MYEPLISVIIPIYNVEKYLNQCIDSVLNQSYRNIEIILVDDGSLDDCGKICDYYSGIDGRIRVIHKKNGGLSSARNEGINNCNGEYIAFVDSDDFVSPYFIEIMYKVIVDTNCDISFLDHGVSFYDHEIERVKLAKSNNDYIVTVLDSREVIKQVLYQKVPTGIPWRMYKRSIFDEIRLPIGYLFEDSATTHKLLMKTSNIALVNADLYAYRIRDNSIMRMTFTDEKLICIKIGEQIVEDIRHYDESIINAAYNRAFTVNYQVFNQIPYEDIKSRNLVFEELIKYRKYVIFDNDVNVRIKNRIGALCTYLGPKIALVIGKKYRLIKKK